ncbi:putative peroxisomal leader peptide-processing protease [Scophthalmus maximus]|uniref:Peroxisomal leader peptide-processing protease n=1 Tax=Scophthalmus maximus TaxID=52904 RepID=A0A2U9CGC9_SCOMX|nr:peroxisomal leader peptide-processing protease [Scophthalmus maximus]AWP13932.1 putative peroxisomal leader peptide-processing protease [Scophthalmus maximus]
MELAEVERCCCVVKVSEATSARKPVSCSGVIVHPRTGTVICAGLPFSRFIADKETFSSDRESTLLPPRGLSDKLKIRVSFSSGRHADSDRSAARGDASAPRRAKATRQREVAARLLMLVKCQEFKQAFGAVFREADRWRFHGDDEDEELIRDAHCLSWFAVLKTGVAVEGSPDSGSIPWQSSSSLGKGCPVIACGSPFGSLCLDLFISTLSRGIISNLAGEENAVVLTDARCLPGTEGGGLFSVEGADSVRLIGLIVSPFGWKANEWIGLTLVCSVHLIFRSMVSCASTEDPLRDVWLQPGEVGLRMSTTARESEAVKYPTVCFVDSGQVWGSGVVVTPRLVLTCRHVVNGKSTVTLKFHHRDRVRNFVGDVLFSTKSSSPYDLALVQLRHSVPGAVVPRMAQSFNPGESLVVVGYGGLGRGCGPSLTGGVLSKAIILNNQPVMLQTTCAVQAGASGGAVVRAHTGELLGIVVSNTKDLAAKVTYPHLNFSIPATVFHRLLQRFHQTEDLNVFRMLDATDKERRVWRLQGAQSKL